MRRKMFIETQRCEKRWLLLDRKVFANLSWVWRKWISTGRRNNGRTVVSSVWGFRTLVMHENYMRNVKECVSLEFYFRFFLSFSKKKTLLAIIRFLILLLFMHYDHIIW